MSSMRQSQLVWWFRGTWSSERFVEKIFLDTPAWSGRTAIWDELPGLAQSLAGTQRGLRVRDLEALLAHVRPLDAELADEIEAAWTLAQLELGPLLDLTGTSTGRIACLHPSHQSIAKGKP